MKHPSQISILDFTYDLPAEKIAAYPLANRDESKLLVFKDQQIGETIFKNLPDFLDKNTVLVFNNTKVIQARLNFLNSKNKNIEIFCLEPAGNVDVALAMASRQSTRWNCLVGNLKQWKEEALLILKGDVHVTARIIEKRGSHVVIDFSWTPTPLSFAEVLDLTGAMPIPPYLKRESENIDLERYQTIYASNKGSVAAPTAGLHFTEGVLESLNNKLVQRLEVTLHVGAGTFKPVKSDTMQGHEMHAEWIEVNIETIRQLLEATKKNVIAVGTTSLRTLETLYWMGVKAINQPGATIDELEIKQWDPYDYKGELPGAGQSLLALLGFMQQQGLQKILCKTQILIAPPYQLKIAGGIITNFHQPQSTLLLIVSAITGDKWRSIYDYALKNNFRFLSYGDSSLLLK